MKSKYIPLIIVIALSVGVYVGFFFAQRQQENILNTFGGISAEDVPQSKTSVLLNMIETQYVDTVNMAQIEEKIIPEIIKTLDPHSSYIPAKDIEEINSDLNGSFSGIGVQFNLQNDTIYVVDVIRGGPSEKAGLLAGDRIVEVNDTVFVGKDINNEKVIKKLRGKKHTNVKLGIKRRNTKEILHYNVVRDDIPVHSVEAAYLIAPRIGYIFVSKFGAKTYSEFLTAIAKLKNQGASEFIIDLRGNSGGYLDAAINMINEFLVKGQLIVYTEGKALPRSEVNANGSGSCKADPIVVLIDEFSGSASEIFAGAIQDNDRGLIVGRRSFGKGLVQQQIPFADNSAVRLTIARYYTPAGRCIQKPYEMGNSEDYNMEIMNRYKHGEFYSQDSIKQQDSVQFKTLNGRIVYGGGGIMPDVFVPSDTSDVTPFFTKLVNHAVIYKFALNYSDENRQFLKSKKNWATLEVFLEEENLMKELLQFAEKREILASRGEVKKSERLIKKQLYAYIARNTLGEEEFYRALNQTDECVQIAIGKLNNKKEFSELLLP
jgi:carboxyl-terminal processing protease